MRPKVVFPCSSAGSDLEVHDQFSADLPYDAISNAKTFVSPDPRFYPSQRCGYSIPGNRIQGYSHTGWPNRQLIIDRYGTPAIYDLPRFKRHAKIRRAPIARR